MTDITYGDTLEWMKKITVAYIEGYEKFLRAAAYYPAYYPMISAKRARDRARASARAAKRRARLSIENLNRYTAVRTLRDGMSVSVRAVRAEDKARLLEHFTRLSSASLYYRFLGTRSSLTDEELTALPASTPLTRLWWSLSAAAKNRSLDLFSTFARRHFSSPDCVLGERCASGTRHRQSPAGSVESDSSGQRDY